MRTEDIATHSAPAWRDRSDFLLRADLSPFEMPGRWEQLWARSVASGQYELCCIPFFTYGLALGDILSATPDPEQQYVLQRVVSRSGHRNARIAVQLSERGAEVHEPLHAIVAEAGLLYEWHGTGYLAIDIPPGVEPESVVARFSEYIDAGLVVGEVDT